MKDNELKEFFGKFDRLITEYPELTVGLSDASFCDVGKKKIWLNAKKYRELEDKNPIKALWVIKGFNAHELAHVDHTYANWHKISYFLKDIFNCVEDCRVETLFSKRFPIVKKYFVASILTCLKNIDLDSKHSIFSTYISVYGRKMILGANKYLAMIDKLFEEKFGLDIAKKLRKLIDKFLVSEKFTDQKEIVSEIGCLLDKNNITRPKSNSSSESLSSTRKKQASGWEKKAIEAVKKDIKETNKQIESDKKKIKISERTFKRVLNKNLKKIETEVEKEITDEIKKDLKRIEIQKQRKLEKLSVPSEKIVNSIVRHIKTFRISLGSSWVNKYSGLIDTRKVMNFNKTGNLRLFKRYKKNRIDETKMAVVINIDSSGSMNNFNRYKEANECAKILCEALERTGSFVMVREFSEVDSLIKDFDTKRNYTNWNKYARSSLTNPSISIRESIKELVKIRVEKDIKHLLIINLTDGGWNEFTNMNTGENIWNSYKKLLASARIRNIKTVAVGIGLEVQYKHSKNLKVNKSEDLPDVFKKIIMEFHKQIMSQIVEV